MSSKKRKSNSSKGSNKKPKPDKEEKKVEVPSEKKKSEQKAPEFYLSYIWATLSGGSEPAQYACLRTRVCKNSYDEGLKEFRQLWCEVVFLFEDLITRLEATEFRNDEKWNTDMCAIWHAVEDMAQARLRGRTIKTASDFFQLMPDGRLNSLRPPELADAWLDKNKLPGQQ